MPIVKKSNTLKTKKIGQTNEASYKNLLYGVLSVIVLFAIFLLGVKLFAPKHNTGTITPEAAKTSIMMEARNASVSGEMAQKAITPTILPTIVPTQVVIPQANNKLTGKTEYTVQNGDSLWTISEKFYKTGYNWTLIARENNLSNPGSVFAGNMLIIPAITQATIAQENSQSAQQPTVNTKGSGSSIIAVPLANKITGNNYTVQHEDTLWDISIRAYGDGYRWVDIAKTNNLTNPDLIFSGNVLHLPRP